VRPLVFSDWLAGVLFWATFSVWCVVGGRRALRTAEGQRETVSDRG
jgi:hypothetical protein